MLWEGIWISLFVRASSLWLALPKLSPWRTRGVPIVWGWAKCLLFLVVADESEFDRDREKEEDAVLLVSRFKTELSD